MQHTCRGDVIPKGMQIAYTKHRDTDSYIQEQESQWVPFNQMDGIKFKCYTNHSENGRGVNRAATQI